MQHSSYHGQDSGVEASITGKTSSESLDSHIAGHRIAGCAMRTPRDVIVQIFTRDALQENFIVPAVAEPLIVWILKGGATVEERSFGGEWIANEVKAGDFFLTDTDEPYELRWQSNDGASFEVLHLQLGLPLIDRAAKEVYGQTIRRSLRDVSGVRDDRLGLLIEALAQELTGRNEPSPLLIENIAQAVAIHLVRRYMDTEKMAMRPKNVIPAFRLCQVTDLMQEHLAEEFSLGRCAHVAGMSEAHFSRQFKRSTGVTPSQFFIRMRIAAARRLLRETERSIISIGFEVGYLSPSHFSQVFRKETGVSPGKYRGG